MKENADNYMILISFVVNNNVEALNYIYKNITPEQKSYIQEKKWIDLFSKYFSQYQINEDNIDIYNEYKDKFTKSVFDNIIQQQVNNTYFNNLAKNENIIKALKNINSLMNYLELNLPDFDNCIDYIKNNYQKELNLLIKKIKTNKMKQFDYYSYNRIINRRDNKEYAHKITDFFANNFFNDMKDFYNYLFLPINNPNEIENFEYYDYIDDSTFVKKLNEICLYNYHESIFKEDYIFIKILNSIHKNKPISGYYDVKKDINPLLIKRIEKFAKPDILEQYRTSHNKFYFYIKHAYNNIHKKIDYKYLIENINTFSLYTNYDSLKTLQSNIANNKQKYLVLCEKQILTEDLDNLPNNNKKNKL